MTAQTRTVGFAIAAALALASLTAGAQMYKWRDDSGSVTYSNIAPAEAAKVKDVTKIDDINTVPLDQRPKERRLRRETIGFLLLVGRQARANASAASL